MGHAWEARIGAVCEMTHRAADAQWRVTYDPASGEYAITIRRDAGQWPDAPVFAIRFEGDRGQTVSTGRHSLSPDGRAVTVTDRGFGNVLNGLEFNRRAVALAGDVASPARLDSTPPAAPAVAEFRACVEGGLV